MIHAVKELPEHFENVQTGKKTFEVRKNDHSYSVGDLIALNEYNAEEQRYTGRSMLFHIDYILNDNEYCKEGYIVMSIKPCAVRQYDRPYNPMKEGADYSVPLITGGDDNARDIVKR